MGLILKLNKRKHNRIKLGDSIEIDICGYSENKLMVTIKAPTDLSISRAIVVKDGEVELKKPSRKVNKQ